MPLRTVLPKPRAVRRSLPPLVSLGVEALGVLVVAVLVVLGSHTVQRRIEVLGVGVYTLVGLLERQGDAATVQVDVDDLDEYLVTDLGNLLGHLDVALASSEM